MWEMMLSAATIATVFVLASATDDVPSLGLRRELNAPPVVRLVGGKDALFAEYRVQMGGLPSYPFKNFSDAFVSTALAQGVDWREKGAVDASKRSRRAWILWHFWQGCSCRRTICYKRGRASA